MQHSTSQFRAIGYAVLGFALWVAADSCMKWAGEAKMPPYQIVGFMGFFGTIILAARAWLQGKDKVKALWPRNPRMQLGRAALTLAMSILNAIALNHLPLTLFYVTVFTAPLMVALLAAVMLREHLNWQKSLAVVVGFVGVIIAVNPFQDINHGNWIGYAAALTSAICFAFSIVWLRRITQSENSESIVFFAALIQLICGGTASLYKSAPVDLDLFIVLSAMGILCMAGNLAVYSALRYTTASNVSQFHYTQIICGALLGYLIWNEVAELHLVVGAVIIIGSGLYIAAHARKAENLATLNPY